MARPSLLHFKRWAKATAPAARAVVMARAFAMTERERVDAYILPLFATYQFRFGSLAGDDVGRLIEDPKELYLCEDEETVSHYFAACDVAHRAHGFTGPAGHCPALVAENLQRQAEAALIDLAQPLFDISAHALHGEDRAKYLELLLGACIKAESDRSF